MSDPWQNRYVRRVLAETSLSASALALRAKLSSTTLTRPLNNPEHSSEISISTLQKIQDATGIPFAPFAPRGEGGDLGQPSQEVDMQHRVDLVNVYNVSASAGPGIIVDEETVVDRLAFPQGYLSRITKARPADLAVIGVKGNSMEPTLRDDDVVMIDTSKRSLGYDGLFVLNFDNALLVKRISRGTGPGKVMILSDNREEYPAVEWHVSDVIVVGKVIWVGKKA
ncbi:hypothetical protein SDC9_25123 [bioreactor metagenome]|uniref:Peptidase S24/S26A/S26B/S26C domain-containing protein n=1 Tax=bioreactor metagenome TaxID=1076179 RepID=A0A644UJQ4_9ZZZZ